MVAHRPMTVAEKYYTLLDQRWPANVMISADLDRCLDPDLVAERWVEFRERRVLARAVATDELTIVDPGADGPRFSTEELPESAWDRVFDEEASLRHELGTPMRLRYLTSEAEGSSRLLMLGHHSMLDGRIGLAEIQAFVRFLDGQEVPEQQELSVPVVRERTHPWQRDPKELVRLLRELRDRGRELGPAEPAWWPDATGERRPRLRGLVLDPAEAARLVGLSRTHGANLFGTIAASWLTTVAAQLCGATSQATVQLNVPADLSTPSDSPARPTAMEVAVLSHPHRVMVDDVWGTAAEVGAVVREALRIGGGDLFFHLTRVEHVDDLAAGAELVGAAIASSPPSVTVSNMGVVDPGSDPAWLRQVSGQLACAPNQMVFVATLSYRGRLVHNISTDANRVSEPQTEALVDGYLRLLRGLS